MAIFSGPSFALDGGVHKLQIELIAFDPRSSSDILVLLPSSAYLC